MRISFASSAPVCACFSRVTTFNLDEYVGLPVNHPQSYHYFMHEHFFRHVNIPPHNINIPSGTTSNYPAFCQWYERRIKECGGIDLQILGIGTELAQVRMYEPGDDVRRIVGRELGHGREPLRSRGDAAMESCVPGRREARADLLQRLAPAMQCKQRVHGLGHFIHRLHRANREGVPLAGQAAEDNKSQLKDIQQSIAEKEKAVKQQQQQRSSLQDQLRQQEKTNESNLEWLEQFKKYS